MSIFTAGSLQRSKGVIDAIFKQLKLVTLKPAKKVVIKFDPFHEKAPETRYEPQIRPVVATCFLKRGAVYPPRGMHDVKMI